MGREAQLTRGGHASRLEAPIYRAAWHLHCPCMVEEASMHTRFARLVLPAVILALGCLPAAAQIRLGVDLGDIRIRIAPDAPPPLRHEVRMERPSRNHVWIAGCWDRRDDRWAWVPGRWEEPSQRGSSWVRAQYRREDGAYRYEPGHWSHQRMAAGEDYSRWHKDHGRGHDKDRHDNGRGHER